MGSVTVSVGGVEEGGAGEAGGESVVFEVEAVRKPPLVVVVKGAPFGMRPGVVGAAVHGSGCRVLAEPKLRVEKLVVRVRGKSGEVIVEEVERESRDWEVCVEGDGGVVGVPTHVFFTGKDGCEMPDCVACEVVVPPGVDVPRLQACLRCGGFGHEAAVCVPPSVPSVPPRSYAEMVRQEGGGVRGVPSGVSPGGVRVSPAGVPQNGAGGARAGSVGVHCFGCGKPGHVRMFCPAQRCRRCLAFGHKARVCSAPVRCVVCRKSGHMSYECPERVPEKVAEGNSPQQPAQGQQCEVVVGEEAVGQVSVDAEVASSGDAPAGREEEPEGNAVAPASLDVPPSGTEEEPVPESGPVPVERVASGARAGGAGQGIRRGRRRRRESSGSEMEGELKRWRSEVDLASL